MLPGKKQAVLDNWVISMAGVRNLHRERIAAAFQCDQPRGNREQTKLE